MTLKLISEIPSQSTPVTKSKLRFVGEDLSGADKARGFALKSAEGATFGTSSAVAPAVYAATGKALEYLKGVPKQYQTPFKELYKEGRESYKQAAGGVEREYPKLSTTAEIAGGLPMVVSTGASTISGKGVPLLKKMLTGGKIGLKYGASYGAGSNIAPAFESENLQEGAGKVAWGAAKGGAAGGATGFLAPAVISPVIERVTPPIKRLVKSIFGGKKSVATEDIVNAVTMDKPIVNPSEIIDIKVKPELIEQSIRENVPLISLGGKRTVKLAQKAKLNNDSAADILEDHAKQALGGQPAQVESVINKHLGKISPADNLDAIQLKYKAEATPLYKQAMNYGEVQSLKGTNVIAKEGVESTISPLEKNLQRYIKKARNSPLGLELEGLPNNHIKVLDAAKQQLDDEIGRAIKSGARNESRALQGIKKQLLESLDNEVPMYADARKVASDNLSLMEAQDSARKFLRGESVETIKQKIKGFTPAEQEAFVLGVRQELIDELYKTSKTGRTNVAERVFNDSETSMLRKKLKLVLGKEKYEALIKDIEPLVKHGQNIGELIGGSQTAEKQGYRLMGTQGALRKELGKVMTEKVSEPYEIVARMLTDPKYLAENMKNYRASKITDLLYQTPKTSGGIGGIIGGLDDNAINK